MNPLEFEKAIKDLDRSKYHVNRTLGFTKENTPYLAEWSIFRKDMPTEEYFDPNNLAVLSSNNGNTLEDIKEFIRKEK